MDDVKREIDALRAEIEEHNRHYYDEDAPIISDFEYDALLRSWRPLTRSITTQARPRSMSAERRRALLRRLRMRFRLRA